jgi:tetratricopeptide (TPR) repeat protein
MTPAVCACAYVCAFFLLSAAGAQAPSEAARHRERGAALLAANDPIGALAAYHAAVALDPTDASSHDAIGVILGDGGDLPGALAAFREAIRRNPLLAVAHFHLGLALERSERTEEAIAAYIRSLRLAPNLVEARYGLSSATAELGDLDGAIALLRQVVTRLPKLAEAHYNLGVHYSNRYKRASGRRYASDQDAAVEALTTAVRLSPNEARFHAALGRLLADKQDLEGALASLRRARTLEPNRLEHAYDLGLVLRLAGDLDGAEAQFRAVVSGDPGNGLARRALGLVLRTNGDLSGAASELRAAVRTLPEDAQAHHLLGSLLLKLGETSTGFEELRRAIELDSSLIEPRVALAQALARSGRQDEARQQQQAVQRLNAEKAGIGRAMILIDSTTGLLEQGDTAKALPLLREAIDLAPALTEAHFQLALGLRRSYEAHVSSKPGAASGPDPAAIEAELLRVIELDPAHAPAYAELGMFHASRGDTVHALAALRRAASLAPGLVTAQRALADQAAVLEDWPTVVAALEAVMAWQPEDPSAPLNLARTLLRQRECAGAVAVFQHAVRLQPDLASADPALDGALKRCGVSP